MQSWAGYDLARGVEVDTAALSESGPAGELARGAVRVEVQSRLYACPCTAHGELAEQALDPAEGPSHPLKALPWRCGGHEALTLPATLDGETVSLAQLPDLAARALLGAAPSAGRPWPEHAVESELVGAWLAHLYALLPDEPGVEPGDGPEGPARAAVTDTVSRRLADPAATPAELTVSLDFYLFHPAAPGAERVAEVLRDAPGRLSSLPLPWSRRRDLTWLAWKVLVERLRRVADPVALSLARDCLVKPGAVALEVLLRLGAHDPDWVALHAPDIVRANPELLPSLVDAMCRWSAPVATATVAALTAAAGVDRAAVIEAVQARLWSPAREAVLAAISS